MYFLNTKSLVIALANNQIKQREVVNYLLASWLLYICISYSTFIYTNASRSWWGGIEFFCTCIVTIWGVFFSYEKYIRDADSESFINDLTCLLLPITLKVYFVVWGFFYLTGYLFRLLLPYLSFDSEELANLFISATQNIDRWMIFLAVIATQIFIYWRLGVHLAYLNRLRVERSK